MTPAEHYLEAARILSAMPPGTRANPAEIMANAAIAEGHATLALAGATLLAGDPSVYETARHELGDAITEVAL